MIKIDVSVNGLDEIQRQLAGMPRKIEVATQRALIKIANHVRDAEQEEMRRVFNQPTRWTLGAMRVKPTSDGVIVGIIDPEGAYKRANNYLGTQVSGGQRRAKAMESALQQYGLMPSGWHIVPGVGAKLDSNGNISAGQIRQILSWFDAAERWSGSTQNMGDKGRDKRRKGTRKTAGFEYFCVHPNHQNNRYRLEPGIYQRFFFAMGKSIKPVLIFVKRTSYKPRFNFEAVARRTVDKYLSAEVEAAINRELGS